MGTNLETPTYVSRDWVFVDSMKAADPFISNGEEWNDGRPLTLDPQGYPTQLLDDQAALTIAPTFEGGRMVLTYDGQGDVTIESALKGSLEVTDRGPGRIEFEVPRDTELFIRIRRPQVGDHVRNLRLVPVRFEKSDAVFHPEFLARLAPFKVVRFMDWAQTNNQKLERWADRTRPDFLTQSVKSGVAYEYMVRLGNVLQADIWVCVPHRADDGLVRSMAELIAAGLDRELKVYVEYSNEIWNGIFEQARYATEQGRKRGLAPQDFQASARWQSQRSVEIFKMFETAFADRPGTLVRVMASQVGNKWHHGELLDFKDARAHVDAIAVGPYFGYEWGAADRVATIKAKGVAKVLDLIRQSAKKETEVGINGSAAYAAQVGKPLIAYEGGQHLVLSPEVHNDAELDRMFDDMQRHPKMGVIYNDLLMRWKGAGGQLFVHFTFAGAHSKWSKYGIIETIDQPRDKSPKLDAVLTFIERHPQWW